MRSCTRSALVRVCFPVLPILWLLVLLVAPSLLVILLGLLCLSVLSSTPADEIIRQVTINCSERGLLLLRVRDEMRMTVGGKLGSFSCSFSFPLLFLFVVSSPLLSSFLFALVVRVLLPSLLS